MHPEYGMIALIKWDISSIEEGSVTEIPFHEDMSLQVLLYFLIDAKATSFVAFCKHRMFNITYVLCYAVSRNFLYWLSTDYISLCRYI